MKKIFANILILFCLFEITLSLTTQQCTGTCGSNQVMDCMRCQCIPVLNCTTQPPDIYDCSNVQCAINGSWCPNLCYCKNPSALNNYCPVCLNGGIRNYSSDSCQCICPPGYQGERCQFSPNPCLSEDSPDCANINCYNTTENMFFNCQRKCLCCANEQCFNLGLLTTVTTSNYTDYCSCSCISSNFSPNDNCLTPVNCVDSKYCSVQFGVYATNNAKCVYPFVSALCPASCGLCTGNIVKKIM